MTPFIIAFALLAAAAGVWGLISRNRVKRRAAEKGGEENERLGADEKLACESAEAAEAKVLNDARLQAESEERNRKEAEVQENARLAEEQRLAEERLSAETEAKRRAEEQALADAQVWESARLKAEAEARQRVETEALERARVAEEERRAEERRQVKEQAKRKAEAYELARLAAEERARQQAEADALENARVAEEVRLAEQVEAKTAKEKMPSESHIVAPSPQKPPENDEVPRPPTYQPTAPSPTNAPSRPPRPAGSRTAQASNADLHLRVQLVFGRGGVVRTLALVPDRRDGLRDDVVVNGTQGELHLTELREDCYEPVTLLDAGSALFRGVEWIGRGDARRWRWVLGGRELYVLAPGDEFGLHGFVSTARLWLNSRHVILATKRLRDEVLTALAQVGCNTPVVSDETDSGVPPGWLLFRDVIPTRAVPMRDYRDILNALCPAHDIEAHFVGGIRLVRNTWLAGYPPRIRFTGEIVNGFAVKIDGHTAQPAGDGAFEAPGWDSDGEHRLWFGDRAETYSLYPMKESWEQWHAHDFGTGAAICGASMCQLDAVRRRQVRVPATNPLLIGARPGEIYCCHVRGDIRCEALLAMVSFDPVWALPPDPAHVNKQAVRVLLLHPRDPQNDIRLPSPKISANRKLVAWIAAIRDAGCKGLRLKPEDDHSKLLWQRYRAVAKQLRRMMR